MTSCFRLAYRLVRDRCQVLEAHHGIAQLLCVVHETVFLIVSPPSPLWPYHQLPDNPFLLLASHLDAYVDQVCALQMPCVFCIVAIDVR